jgi:hypothetical protein
MPGTKEKSFCYHLYDAAGNALSDPLDKTEWKPWKVCLDTELREGSVFSVPDGRGIRSPGGSFRPVSAMFKVARVDGEKLFVYPRN